MSEAFYRDILGWFILFSIADAFVMGTLGFWLAGEKGRSELEGLILGFLFGPLGVLIEGLLPTDTARLDVRRLTRIEAQRIAQVRAARRRTERAERQAARDKEWAESRELRAAQKAAAVRQRKLARDRKEAERRRARDQEDAERRAQQRARKAWLEETKGARQKDAIKLLLIAMVAPVLFIIIEKFCIYFDIT
jgi:flagellar biosynthesis GTPase FlhF